MELLQCCLKIKILVLFFLMSAFLYAEEIVISVSDFKVESGNPAYQYLGKGISRLVSNELNKSRAIRLLEREEIKKLLAEQEFSLSDLADETKQVKIGAMLSAQKMIFGEVIDMGNAFLISLRMADVTTGEIVWQEQLTEALKTYDYIGAYFAKSALAALGIKAEKVVEEKVVQKVVKDEKAIVNISNGIDAFDKGETEKARQALEAAKKIDPQNEVATFYLNKLIVNTTKFKVNGEPFYSYQNPAFLGILRMDRIHFESGFLLDELLARSFYSKDHAFISIPGYDKEIREQDYTVNAGYYFPLGKRLGLGVEAFWALVTNDEESISKASGFAGAYSRRSPIGGTLNLGYLTTDWLALGLGVSVYSQIDYSSVTPTPDYVAPLAVSGNAGFLLRNSDESLVYDTRVGYSTGTMDSIDPAEIEPTHELLSTIFMENSLTCAFNEKKSFLVFKQLNDLAVDRMFYYGRLLPAFEQFFTNWFSMRLGLEGAIVVLGDSTNLGYGVLGGFTFRIINWGLDIDTNLTYRLKPSRVVEGLMMPQCLLLINFNFNGLFMKREQ